MTKQELIDFETEIAKCFEQKQIRAPIHLYSGNEDEIIKVFADIKPDDWVFCSWRSHYQCLLKGVPPNKLKQAILDGKSIALSFPEYRIFSSAIVGGNIPIAVGVALSIKQSNGTNRVHCFVGDMTAETGIMWESFKYAMHFRLPIRFIIEDNDKSVCTPTRKTWNATTLTFDGANSDMVYHYRYSNRYPHAGSGTRIQF